MSLRGLSGAVLVVQQHPVQVLGQSCVFLTLLLCTDGPLDNPVASSRLSERESIACLAVPRFRQQ